MVGRLKESFSNAWVQSNWNEASSSSNMKKVTVLFAFGVAFASTAYAQWTPSLDRSGAMTYEPVCQPNRKQVRVRLLDSTHFLLATDVKAGALLYAVRFTAKSLKNENGPVTGVAYCEPYVYKELGFFASYNEKSKAARARETGYFQCLFDFNDDKVFDDANGSAYYLKIPKEISRDHQYRYEVVEVDGPPEIGCPRPNARANALRISEAIWAALTPLERERLQGQGGVDLIPVKEFGLVIGSQRLNASTPGSSGGAALGESIAAANYVDKSVGNGTYSAKGQLKAQILGAMVGGMIDEAPRAQFRTRYAVKNALGEIVSIDQSSDKEDFAIANGVCVSLPGLDQIEQFVCEANLQSFKVKYLGEVSAATRQSKSKEVRLRELKGLFEQGLVSEKVYLEQQKEILSD